MTVHDPDSKFFEHLERGPSFRSVLCLGGSLPNRAFFERISLPRIAADGASSTLVRMGIAPSLIIGDLDSTPYRLQQQYPCVQIADQSSSDFQKALIYLREHELLPAIILGVNGGYLDHILCNLAIFAQEGDCLLYDSPHMMGVALDVGEYRYEHWPVNSKFSLIGAPEATVSSQGLKWELRHERLSMWDIRSFFHRTSAEEVVFKVHEGRLVVLLYLEAISDAGGE